MSIQANINQSLSIAGFLFQQGIGNKWEEKRAAEKAIGSAQKQIDKAIERAPLDYSGKRGEDISVDAAYDVYNQVLEKYGANDPELAVEARREQLATQKEQQEQQQKQQEEALKKPSSVEEARATVDTLIEQYTPSKSDQMADKAATRLAEEQTRRRNENNIDRRKIHRESLREKGRIRAEKKSGGIQ